MTDDGCIITPIFHRIPTHTHTHTQRVSLDTILYF
jgi:hypothetical protein